MNIFWSCNSVVSVLMGTIKLSENISGVGVVLQIEGWLEIKCGTPQLTTELEPCHNFMVIYVFSKLDQIDVKY